MAAASGRGGSSGSGGEAAAGSGGGGAPGSPDRVSFVHGLSDVSSVKVCFARASGEPLGSPAPEQGLGYGAHLTLSELPGVSFEQDDLDLLLFAGELERIAGLDCAAAVALARSLAEAAEDAGPAGGAAGAAGASNPGVVLPPLLAAPLVRIPAGTFFGGRSALLVGKGCFAGRTDPEITSVCGDGYSPAAPTLEPVIVALSRSVEFDRVGVQVVHATTDAGSFDVVLRLVDGTTRAVAANLGPGTVAPASNPAFVADSRQLEPATATVEVLAPVTGAVLQNIALDRVQELGGLAEWQNARGYALVVIGPTPALRAEGFWNQPAVTVVPAQPD